MRIRSLLIATAILSAILGGFAVYLAMSVPNDLKADSMLKHARKELEAGKREPARDELSRIVQQYPRTDAAAAATVALVKLGDQERKELQAELARLRKEYEQNTTAMSGLQKTVEDIRNAPPKEVVIEVPAKKAPVKPPAAKKTPQRRRRRR